MREHPEFVPVDEGAGDRRSVGNTLALHETSLVEAFNLKAAIEHSLGERAAAVDTLGDMPPRREEELDAVTLHNTALMNMETRPADGIAQLQFLLTQIQSTQAPKETFANLLLIFVKYEYYDLAADVLAEHAHLTYKHLSQVGLGLEAGWPTVRSSSTTTSTRSSRSRHRPTTPTPSSRRSPPRRRTSSNDSPSKCGASALIERR